MIVPCKKHSMAARISSALWNLFTISESERSTSVEQMIPGQAEVHDFETQQEPCRPCPPKIAKAKTLQNCRQCGTERVSVFKQIMRQ